ncbi:hypothetical protein CANARDRAFT_120400 [[Candida] arabinofermentans NRRL YB-2248]|uniref:Mid2 domain-containing protein n=1 Tax=[Candida] arabinofermentans NRRL YB-2248 TaxID=983967 RepID=A0A1E4T5C0_9ASCO|nr:hypothetical protein CANARDRAFT_120400 [[Candida] arabinofermentans NRRL YB-2248]
MRLIHLLQSLLLAQTFTEAKAASKSSSLAGSSSLPATALSVSSYSSSYSHESYSSSVSSSILAFSSAISSTPLTTSTSTIGGNIKNLETESSTLSTKTTTPSKTISSAAATSTTAAGDNNDKDNSPTLSYRSKIAIAVVLCVVAVGAFFGYKWYRTQKRNLNRYKRYSSAGSDEYATLARGEYSNANYQNYDREQL